MTDERCATCGSKLPRRAPMSPMVRYCQTHWWEAQRLAYAAYEPTHPLALSVLQGWWAS